jgi:hypothetical protein
MMVQTVVDQIAHCPGHTGSPTQAAFRWSLTLTLADVRLGQGDLGGARWAPTLRRHLGSHA